MPFMCEKSFWEENQVGWTMAIEHMNYYSQYVLIKQQWKISLEHWMQK